jgi:EF hand
MRHLLAICALASVALTACRASPNADVAGPMDVCRNPVLKIDRGDWHVSQGSRIWKVKAAPAANRPPRLLGYLEERRYRQMRGGPEFQIYTVTSLDRNDQIGHITQLGSAVRYEPRRDGTFEEVPVGTNTRENNVAAIFDTTERITLEPTSERRLAFEAIDANGDGVLQKNETANHGDRIAGADSNKDGVVDFEEFDAVDVL